jgi:hypothetical protein
MNPAGLQSKEVVENSHERKERVCHERMNSFEAGTIQTAIINVSTIEIHPVFIAGISYACHSSTFRIVSITLASGYALISSGAKHTAGISDTAYS